MPYPWARAKGPSFSTACAPCNSNQRSRCLERSKCQGSWSFSCSLNKYSLIQYLISVRHHTRHKGHNVKEGGMSLLPQSTLFSLGFSLKIAQQVSGNNLCKPTINQNTNSQATPTTFQVILMRHFPMLFQVLRGFHPRHYCFGPKGDLVKRKPVTCWQPITVQVGKQKARSEGASTLEASAQPETVKHKS